MPAKNEIVPLDAGPTRQTLVTPSPIAAKPAKGVRHDVNGDALSAQERRIRLVSKQRRYTTFQVFYALFGIALMVVQMEYLWFTNTKDFDDTCPVDATTHCPTCLASLPHAVPVPQGRMMLHALRVLISFSTLILLYYIHRYYAAECDVLKIKNIVPPKATLLSSPLRFQLLGELVLFAIHPFPGLETIDPRWPNLVVTSSLLMLPRIFLLYRMLQFRDSFNSSNGWFIGALTNVDFTAAFFLKSTLRNRPSRWIITSFMVLLAATSYSLFVVERFLCTFHADSCCAPIRFTDAVWGLVITMLTIGYGDVVPHTHPGRFFSVLAGFFGTLFTAVTIAVMSSYLVLTRSEHKVNAFIKKDENRRLINDHAARALQAYVQLRAVQRRAQGLTTKSATAAVTKAEHKLYDVLRVYRQVKRYVNSHDVSDPMDKQMTMLEMMEVNVEYIRTKIEDLSDLFHAQVDKHNKSKRKLQTAAVTTNAALTIANAGASVSAQATKRKPSVSNVPSSGDEGSFCGPRLMSEVESTAPPGTTESGVEAGPPLTATVASVPSSTTSNRVGGVPGQPINYDSDSVSHTPRNDLVSEIVTRRPNGLISQGSSRTVSFVRPDTIAGPPEPVAPSNPPDWAVTMEKTMFTILNHVTQVSDEMDALRTRVQTQMDELQDRISNLEKRMGVQDAFREIVRAPSLRKNVVRAPTEQYSDVVEDAVTTTHGVGHTTNGSVLLGGVSRLGRMSFKQRPSIHNFVTSKDLEEFHNSGSID